MGKEKINMAVSLNIVIATMVQPNKREKKDINKHL